ncbi:MAG: RNA polymerase sigma factor [Micromonosporaceae bacterium]|nr:RNA polymerase sigma factor [Micromonosporaceae bacterium]
MVAVVRSPAWSQAPDAAVVEASLRDPEVFVVLYDRYAAALYRYACRRLGSAYAEDVVAETFAAAFARRHRYDLARADARPWLFGVLCHEIATYRRREQARYRALARVPETERAESLADRVSAEVTARAVTGQLADALRRLSTGDRDVLLLIAWGELSYEEVAQALRIPVGTVRSRLNRVRGKLRAALGGVDPTTIVEE